ncbi:Uncharacterized protein SCF082_LOCUS25705 [Durusdinium trenchii]|uniref:DUF1275 domain-containing protein n=1 Tax=Durusdinium trenchii TaxID=1381693 RepID=A0ABP0M1U9_9DINO
MVSSEEWRFQKHAGIATLLAFVAGYADVVSLVRYQAFSSILTGNVIYLGRVSVTPQADDKHTGWFYVAVCLTFMIGSFMQRLCELAWPNRGGSIAAVPLVGLMMISEVLYLITDWQYHEQVLRWTVVFVSPLFGVVSAACSTGRMGTHTTMVTGHILNVTQIVARRLYGEKITQDTWKKFTMSIMVIGGTVGGACIGSLALMSTKSHILLFPMPIVIYILLWLHDHLARPRSLIKKVQKRWRENSDNVSVSDSHDDSSVAAASDDESESHV